jgi:hypothetical protein
MIAPPICRRRPRQPGEHRSERSEPSDRTSTASEVIKIGLRAAVVSAEEASGCTPSCASDYKVGDFQALRE